MAGKIKWTKEKTQLAIDKIYSKSLIVITTEMRTISRGRKSVYVKLKCKNCGDERWSRVSNIINKGKSNCKKCKSWTIQQLQEKSNEIYNNKFIIYQLERRNIGKQNQTSIFIDIECNVCNYRNWILVNNHINKKQSCGGVCKGTVHRESQIYFLKNNLKQANQPYKLYFLKFTHKETNEQFYKIGKTNRNIKERFIYKEYNNYNIEKLRIKESTHLWVAEQEDNFINKYGYIPNEKFGGHTECFSLNIINEF